MTTGTTALDNAPQPEEMEQNGYLRIRELWQNGTNSVHDMRVVNTYAKSHSEKLLEKCLQEAERVKKLMYLEACFQKRRHLSLFVASVHGLMGVEAMTTLKRIYICLTTK